MLLIVNNKDPKWIFEGVGGGVKIIINAKQYKVNLLSVFYYSALKSDGTR